MEHDAVGDLEPEDCFGIPAPPAGCMAEGFLAGIFPADTGGGGLCPAEGGTEGADAPVHIVALCVDVPECVKKDSVVVEDTPCGFEKVGVDGADGTSVGFGA